MFFFAFYCALSFGHVQEHTSHIHSRLNTLPGVCMNEAVRQAHDSLPVPEECGR